MARYTGKELVVQFGGTDLSANYRVLDIEETAEAVEVITGAAAYKAKQDGAASWSAALSLLDETGGTTLWGAVAVGATGTLEWAPEGTTVGEPRHYALAMVAKRDRHIPYEGAVEISVDFDGWGTVTDTAY